MIYNQGPNILEFEKILQNMLEQNMRFHAHPVYGIIIVFSTWNKQKFRIYIYVTLCTQIVENLGAKTELTDIDNETYCMSIKSWKNC